MSRGGDRPAVVRGLARSALLSLLSSLLVACGGGAPPRQSPEPFDARLEQTRRAGLEAFSAGLYEQAADAFRRALTLAYERDDSPAVVDARYNLAASLTEMGAHEQALERLREASAELERGGRPASPDILLLQGVVSYRAGRRETAHAMAEAVRRTAGVAPEIVARAWFLEGLVAADEGDREGVQRAVAALAATPGHAKLEADRRELAGLEARLDGDDQGAVIHLTEAARARSSTGDYRGAARGLAAAAQAAQAAGLGRDAAQLYLRAGRSAAARGAGLARPWLQRSVELARAEGDEATADEAAAALARLDSPRARERSPARP